MVQGETFLASLTHNMHVYALLYSMQPQRHFRMTGNYVEGAAVLFTVHHLCDVCSAHQLQLPLSGLIHSRQHCLNRVGSQLPHQVVPPEVGW